MRTLLTTTVLAIAMSFPAMAHKGGHGKKAITQYQDRIVSFRMENLQLSNPFARKAKKGQNSAAFVKITNTSNKAQKIVAASSPVANVIELHTSTEENGVHKMRPVKFIEAPAGGVVELKSGGFHIMLIDLKHDLVVNQEIPVTLEMDNGNKIDATYKVKGCCGSCHGKKGKKGKKARKARKAKKN